MKSFCLLISVFWFANFSTATAQDVPDIAVFSFEDISCAAWTRSAGDELLRVQYRAWFRGFVSGYNFGNSANQVRLDAMPDLAAVDGYVDKFCRDNPLLTFVGAALPLVRDNREFRVPVAPSKR